MDYRGLEVTPESFVRLLTGRLAPSTPRSKRLRTSKHSNILVYMTGHGGEEFLKFQDNTVLSSDEMGDCFEQMHQQHRYNQILFMIETCHGESMIDTIHSPNVIGMSSSIRKCLWYTRVWTSIREKMLPRRLWNDFIDTVCAREWLLSVYCIHDWTWKTELPSLIFIVARV